MEGSKVVESGVVDPALDHLKLGLRLSNKERQIPHWNVCAVRPILDGQLMDRIFQREFKEAPSTGSDLKIAWYNCQRKVVDRALPPMYIDQAFLDDLDSQLLDTPSLEDIRKSGVLMFSISAGIVLGVIKIEEPDMIPTPRRG
jgi:hypothetical protein